MRLHAALLLLTLGLPAAEPSWPGGEIALGEACALLVAAGYPTSLDPELDPDLRAELPLITGGYWSAVLAIGSAFDCLPAPPEHYVGYRDRRARERGMAVDLEAGPVLLIPRGEAAPRFSAHGDLLIEVLDAGVAVRRSDRAPAAGRAGILLRLRLSPDLPLAALGPASFDLHRVRGGGGEAIRWDPPAEAARVQELPLRSSSQRRFEALAVILPQVDPGLTTLQLAGSVRLDLLRSERIERLVQPGHQIPVQLGHGVTVDLWLHAAEQAATTPWQRPGLGLGLPPGVRLGTSPSVTVSDLTRRPLRDFGQRSLELGRLVHYTYLHQVGAGPYQVAVELSLLDRQLELPFLLTIHLP